MSVDVSLGELIERARARAAVGAMNEARAIWIEVVHRAPENVDATISLGMLLLQESQAGAALEYFKRAAQLIPKDPLIQLYLALCHRALADLGEESQAIEKALALDPYFYPALLHRAMLLERTGKMRSAARVFENVLKIVPDGDRALPQFASMIQYAHKAVARNRSELKAFLQHNEQSPATPQTWEEARLSKALDQLASGKKVFYPDPVRFYYPELPSVQFYDDRLFPWLATLEASTQQIRDELLELINAGRPNFAPYIQKGPGSPLNQWEQLNYSPKWSSYFLWQNGVKNEENCARCPQTVRLLESLPMADIGHFSPNAMFSCLDPHTVIPPHTGETNVRLVTHLALVVPDNCVFRVGNEARQWQEGKAFVFDDSVEHEARNDSDQLRVVLIFDIWNPFLSEFERQRIPSLLGAVNRYFAEA